MSRDFIILGIILAATIISIIVLIYRDYQLSKHITSDTLTIDNTIVKNSSITVHNQTVTLATSPLTLDSGYSYISVSGEPESGQTLTVRLPTASDGKYLFVDISNDGPEDCYIQLSYIADNQPILMGTNGIQSIPSAISGGNRGGFLCFSVSSQWYVHTREVTGSIFDVDNLISTTTSIDVYTMTITGDTTIPDGHSYVYLSGTPPEGSTYTVDMPTKSNGRLVFVNIANYGEGSIQLRNGGGIGAGVPGTNGGQKDPPAITGRNQSMFLCFSLSDIWYIMNRDFQGETLSAETVATSNLTASSGSISQLTTNLCKHTVIDVIVTSANTPLTLPSGYSYINVTGSPGVGVNFTVNLPTANNGQELFVRIANQGSPSGKIYIGVSGTVPIDLGTDGVNTSPYVSGSNQGGFYCHSISNNWYISDKSYVGKNFSAASATISGALSAASATISGALSAASATVSGALNTSSATVSGALSAASATVSGALNTSSATVSGALSAASATVSGDFLASSTLNIGKHEQTVTTDNSPLQIDGGFSYVKIEGDGSDSETLLVRLPEYSSGRTMFLWIYNSGSATSNITVQGPDGSTPGYLGTNGIQGTVSISGQNQACFLCYSTEGLWWIQSTPVIPEIPAQVSDLPITLSGTWTNYAGYNPAVVCANGNIRVLKGLVRTGDTSLVGIVPVGYRPSGINLYSCLCSSGGSYVNARVDVNTSGQIIVQSPAVATIEYLSLSGISY